MADEKQNIFDNFDVPVIPVRQLPTSLSATANGIELILSGVAVTPTIVRFSLRPAIQAGEMIHTNFDKMVLTVDGWSSADGGFNASAGGDGKWGITCELGVNLYEKQGEWQLEVAEVTAVELDRHWGEWANPGSNWQPPVRRVITGPWVFRFTLPPATIGLSLLQSTGRHSLLTMGVDALHRGVCDSPLHQHRCSRQASMRFIKASATYPYIFFNLRSSI